jgi:hypothetical protein
MPDMTDDWMHPEQGGAYTFDRKAYDERRRATPFIIQRGERIICTFIGESPGPRWKEWSSHATAKERDAELARLHREHPMWRLRPRDLDFRGRIKEPYGP